MKKLLSVLLVFFSSLSLLAQIRPNPNPPTVTFRQGNANRLNMIVTQAGVTLSPSSSLTMITEIRQTEGGRILASVPMSVGDTASGAVQGILPNLAPSQYVAGLYIKYAGEPEFRAGIAKLEILPPGDIRVITDVTGLNVNLTTTAQILSVKIDATPSSAITGYYAQQVRGDKAHIDSVKVEVTTFTTSASASAASAEAAKNAAISSASTATTQAGIATTKADEAAATVAAKPDLLTVSTFAQAQAQATAGQKKVFIITNDEVYGSSLTIWNGSSFSVLPLIPRSN